MRMAAAQKEKAKKQANGLLAGIFDPLDAIPGIQVLKIALKELNLIKSQKAGLLTAFTLAVVVMGTLALAFGGNYTFNKVDVAIFAPKTIQDFDTADFMKSLKDSNMVNIHSYNSKEKVIDSIKRRESKVGIVINNPEPINKKYVIDLYYDNSSMMSSSIFFEVAKSQVQNISFSMSQKLLKDIWERLGEINSKLGTEVSRIDDFLARLDESGARLESLEQDLNALDIEDAKGALSRQGGKITEFGSKISEFEAELDSFTSTVNEIRQKATASREKIKSYRDEISATNSELDSYTAQLQQARDGLADVPAASAQIDQAIASISGVKARLSSADSELAQTQQELLDLENQISEPESGVLAKLQKNRQELQAISVDIAGTRSDLNSMETFVQKLDDTMQEVKSLIATSKEQKADISEKLNESKAMINSFMESLGELSKVSPDFLADPLILNKIPVFNVEKLGVIAPIALVILLMLTTMLLTGVSFVDERNQGAYSRTLLSTTPKVFVFAGKILGQILFALMQAVIIIALLALVNQFTDIKVTIASGIVGTLLGICIISFAFICWGLLITNFTRNQGTTILISLLLIIPMLFLSGAIIPIELINPAIQSFSQMLPLTSAIIIVSEIMVKGTSLLGLIPEILILVVPAIAILAATIMNKKLK